MKIHNTYLFGKVLDKSAWTPAELEKIGLKALVALYEVTRSVYANIKLDDPLPDLMILARKVLSADDVTVMLVDEHKQHLNIAASTGRMALFSRFSSRRELVMKSPPSHSNRVSM